ncbi:type I-F CRISPR-associated endoribonuclease Cas6/Csy4 [Shewanella electrodiphila]|uniref:Type I-F CRISPR-associated endoribonuclease Cas6/Csy4 n=1 Tax=Shewanella electrodiphila TaxID=934143 RepID=A0ABT0KUL3_9GAMM|nr:type I-F CRISPR-associated endoribonuclease Cas6/Csy4 [Shewanella electrodiphila]MCL1047537.1 type I-F CRISPR-associated endoribonuclease Cas6/Csy4 [Shewanella electrodiphila]
MKYYLDITLLPDVETNLGFLWHKIYQQIHILLVDNKVNEQDSVIGLSFPDYGSKLFPLGNKLRLLAETEQQLIDLNIAEWLVRFDDYVHLKAIKTVPSKVSEYAYFKRKNFKSPSKLRNNVDVRASAIATKNGYDVAEVKKRLLVSIDNLEKQSTLPFINLSSLSTDKLLSAAERRKFLLFIECQKVAIPSDNSSLFTCHGLSRRNENAQAAVPLF